MLTTKKKSAGFWSFIQLWTVVHCSSLSILLLLQFEMANTNVNPWWLGQKLMLPSVLLVHWFSFVVWTSYDLCIITYTPSMIIAHFPVVKQYAKWLHAVLKIFKANPHISSETPDDQLSLLANTKSCRDCISATEPTRCFLQIWSYAV